MLIRVRLFALLVQYVAHATAGGTLEVELPGGSRVADLVARMGLPPEQVRVTFVNGRARPMEWELGPGDAVGIFPAVGGG